LIQSDNLCKVYTVKEKKGFFRPASVKKVVAAQDLSLRIEPGHIVGLLGVNGAGKTTTIRMLAGILAPTSGTFTIDDIDGVRHPKEIKKKVNVITGGERNIYWRLTARENLEYFGALYSVPKAELKERIGRLIDLVGLADSADIPVEKYSKGMKQRLQIARGLINDPKYLFLDEPTLGLDIAIAKELRAYIRDLAREHDRGILLTTHYITEVEELCDRVYLINKGRVIKTGAPHELIQLAQMGVGVCIHVDALPDAAAGNIKALAARYDASVEIGRAEHGVSILIHGAENLSTYCMKSLTDDGLLVKKLEITEPKLEDALMKLTMEG